MGISPWLWALLALLILSGLAYWFLGKPPQQLMTTAPQVTQPAPTVQPKLALSNTAGEVTYSGVVGDERTRNGVIDALRSVFGETTSRATSPSIQTPRPHRGSRTCGRRSKN